MPSHARIINASESEVSRRTLAEESTAMPNPILKITCGAVLATTLSLSGGCSDAGSSPPPAAAASISVEPEVKHAIAYLDAAIESLIAAGLSGEREAMLFSPLTEAEYADRVREFNKAGVVTAEYLEFAGDFQRSVDLWRSLMTDGLARASRAAGDERLEEMERILTSLTNIAEANAAEGRPAVGQLIARDSLKRIADFREIIRNR
ncbi:MAG: hypothetical protein ACNA8P_09935 [Phycisphaerales bacterium]